jgi:hypothetical protein
MDPEGFFVASNIQKNAFFVKYLDSIPSTKGLRHPGLERSKALSFSWDKEM